MSAKLLGLAHRMLGSRTDAEDVVQDAYLRLRGAPGEPENQEAYLTRTVANLCVDRLRRLQRERAAYPGPWLPEPYADVADVAAQDESLSIGFLFLLEQLPPAERVAFVLREAFDMRFREIGELLGISDQAVRQRLSRARRRLRDLPPATTPRDEQRALLNALLTAVASGDAEGLVALLHPQAVAYTDGGGVVSAARIPVVQPARIAQVALHLVRKVMAEGALNIVERELGGAPTLLMGLDGEPHSLLQLTALDGLVRQIFVLRNPHKLAPYRSLLDVN